MSIKAYRNGFRFVRYAQRAGYSNYFLLPNEVFSLGLTSGEIALYAYLVRCEDRETYKCHPSYKTIGKALQISTGTVAKYVRTLEQKGLIRTEQTVITKRNGKKQNGTLEYNIRPIQEAVDRYNERQLQNAEEQQRQKQLDDLLKQRGILPPENAG